MFIGNLPLKVLTRSSFQKCSFRNFRFSAHIKKPKYSNAALFVAAGGLAVYITHKIALSEYLVISENKDLNERTGNRHFDEVINKSRDILQRVKDETGAPGIVIGVSIDGKTVWTEGLGYADVENRVLCSSDSVMRIASISKSITMAAVAKLWEDGKLDLDKPVQEYVPYFPKKTYDGKSVTITCRQLISHLGGIRHYDKNVNDSKKKNETKLPDEKAKKEGTKKEARSEFEEKEYFIKDHYKDVKSSLDLFKDDPLIANPGTKVYYSTHGWTLISAIVEAASKEQFSTHMTKLFKALGMSTTYLDLNDVLIYNRSRNYIKDKSGRLINAPYVDNSYKWAGGGFLSTVGDLLQFANAMLYSAQYKRPVPDKNLETDCKNSFKVSETNPTLSSNFSEEMNTLCKDEALPGYLQSKTMELMWSPVTDFKEHKYGMGWVVVPEVSKCRFCESTTFHVFHTGGAIGASSVLLILPQTLNYEMDDIKLCIPKGIVVAILTNMQSVNLSKVALRIAQMFVHSSVLSDKM